MAVRMKDIAQDLGVSIVTISKVFNNHKDIGAATRERVLRRMKELNYQPSLAAQGLASNQSFMVGLIVPDLVHSFFSEVAQSLCSVIRRKGFGLVISSSNGDQRLEQEEIRLMVRRRVDVLVLASCQDDSKNLGEVAKEVPLILLDRRFKDLDVNFVGTDDVAVGQIATEHLVQMGYKRIAHIGDRNATTGFGRLQGYKNALSRRKMTVLETYILHRSLSNESGDTAGRRAMEKLLKVKPRPDAVFCFNDPAAIGAMNAVIAAGLRIPEDIAIVGAGNIRYAESFKVPLSTVEVSRSALGEAVGELALHLTANKKSKRHKSIVIQPKLIVRESSRAKPQ